MDVTVQYHHDRQMNDYCMFVVCKYIFASVLYTAFQFSVDDARWSRVSVSLEKKKRWGTVAVALGAR